MIKIKRTHNGAIVYASEYPKGQGFIFDSDDEDLGIKDSVQLLYLLIELLSLNKSRYAKEVVRINIEHGDKYSCKDKKCKICHPDEIWT